MPGLLRRLRLKFTPILSQLRRYASPSITYVNSIWKAIDWPSDLLLMRKNVYRRAQGRDVEIGNAILSTDAWKSLAHPTQPLPNPTAELSANHFPSQLWMVILSLEEQPANLEAVTRSDSATRLYEPRGPDDGCIRCGNPLSSTSRYPYFIPGVLLKVAGFS